MDVCAKIFLHILKYVENDVTGILTGYLSDDQKNVLITDCYPLFHNQILAPMTELALLQVDSLASKRDESIVGVYHRSPSRENNDLHSDPTLVNIIQIATKIRNKFKDSIIFIVSKDIPKNSEDLESHSCTLYQYSSDKWSSSNKINFRDSKNVISYILANSDNGNIYKFVDFENHLDFPEKDYTNPWVQVGEVKKEK